MKPRVKVVSIAKDEAAYIAEWVHHHLYLEASSIEVYINRTSDNSVQVLDKLIKQYSNVKYCSADWIDMSHPISSQYLQYIIYAKVIDETRRANDADYILFIDIDEFWFSKDLSLKIPDFITQSGSKDCYVFQWINEDGSQKEFSNISSIIKGKLHKNVKSLISIKAPIKNVQLHYPSLDNAKGVFCDDVSFESVPKHPQMMTSSLSKLRDVMILHRSNRSEFEYLSLLNRGRPSDNIPLKLNRHGYNSEWGTDGEVKISLIGFDDYKKSRREFFRKVKIEAELEIAKDFVKSRYEQTLAVLPKMLKENLKDTLRVIKGTSAGSKLKIMDTPDGLGKEYVRNQKLGDTASQPIQTQVFRFGLVLRALMKKDANTFRDQALYYESKGNFKFAYLYMRVAKMFRPKGPLILKKLHYYQTKKK